jgi:hypothetical protein
MNAQSKPGPVDFDLSRGRVDRRADGDTKRGHDEQVVLVPVSVLTGLDKLAGGEAVRQMARAIGVSFGRRVEARLGSAEAAAKASLEAFVTALAAELAVSGWGLLHLERWGRAMVLVLDHAPALPADGTAALLEGAVATATGRDVHAVELTGDATAAGPRRVLIVSSKTADRARGWLREGVSELDILRRLHDQAPQAGGAA